MSDNPSKAATGRTRQPVDRRDEAVGATLVGLVVVLLGFASGIGSGGPGTAVAGGSGQAPTTAGSSSGAPTPAGPPALIQASSSAAAGGDQYPPPGYLPVGPNQSSAPASAGATSGPVARPTSSLPIDTDTDANTDVDVDADCHHHHFGIAGSHLHRPLPVGALITGPVAEHAAAGRDIRRSVEPARAGCAVVSSRPDNRTARRSIGAGQRARLVPEFHRRPVMTGPGMIRRGSVRVLICVVLCLIVGVLTAPGAQAHAELVSSDPADGAQLAAVPARGHSHLQRGVTVAAMRGPGRRQARCRSTA